MSNQETTFSSALENINRELLLTLGELHGATGRGVPVPDEAVRIALERLLAIHASIKQMEKAACGVDALLANLGGRVLSPGADSETLGG